MKDNCQSFKFKTVQQSPPLFFFHAKLMLLTKYEQMKKKRVIQVTQEINHNHADRKD